jgi:two-component system, OmpR family, phosphate regulon response regulator PhoB
MLPADISKQILIVDRDIVAVEPLRHKLAEVGFRVRVIADGTASLRMMSERPPHLVIFNLDIPGFAALDLIQGLRRSPGLKSVRLIILSSLASEQEVVTALDLGADDYISKPFSVREVVARVSAVLRSKVCDTYESTLRIDELVLDSSANRVIARGKLINLRTVEYRLLEFLMLHAGRAFNRAQLLMNVWGDDRDVDERTVDVNVQRLRKILSGLGCESYIQTVRGFGYRFASPASADALSTTQGT